MLVASLLSRSPQWISSNLSDPVFGFPDVVRFSWAPTKKAIDEGAAKIKWEADDDEDDDQVR